MAEKTIFELSGEGKKSYSLPDIELEKYPAEKIIPKEYLRDTAPGLPEVTELELVRHFTRMSRLNYSVDTQMYPLGSCTMKYNPKVNEVIAQNPNLINVHPYQPESSAQGTLKLLYEIQEYLCEILGMHAVSLQPCAGAHGELLGLLLIKAYHRDRKENRTKIIVSDSSHGTNPSSAHIAGYEVVTIASNERGEVDLNALEAVLDTDTAALMLTNPNTLGLFESKILKISEMVHNKGALLYGDGANMNALAGRFKPGDMGFDVMHVNLHKTFSTPHGGGGPGSGPVGVKEHLFPFLPVPVIEMENNEYILNYKRPKSIGKIHAFYGNSGVIAKAYAYIRSLGAEGLKKASAIAVLNANYMLSKLKKSYKLPYDRLCMHEFVLSADNQASKGVHAKDIAKRLLDYGFYAPTIYFPLIVSEALMIEPAETESKNTLDEFISVLEKINQEDPEMLKNAPYDLPVTRLDEVNAARKPDLSWQPQTSPTGVC